MEDTAGAFTIEPSTGRIFVNNSDPLDREQTPFLELTVYAEETATQELYRSNVSVVMVTLIDVNDNSPVFHPGASYSFVKNAPMLKGDVIGKVCRNPMLNTSKSCEFESTNTK